MSKNLRKLLKDLAWKYLNLELLKTVDDEVLASHNISLPISRITALSWTKKCNAGWMGTGKTYYNDQHQKREVIEHRREYTATLTRLQKRMRVWVLLSREEEDQYLAIRGKSSLPEAMPIGDEIVIDNVQKYMHHMDDQEDWEDHPVMHPLFKPSQKPREDK